MAEMDCKRYTCEGCNTLFDSVRAKRYCTRECNKAHLRKIGSRSTRAEYLADRRAKAIQESPSYFHCCQCGVLAHRKLSGTSKAKGYENKYCSMECRVSKAAQIRAEVVFLRGMARLSRNAIKTPEPNLVAIRMVAQSLARYASHRDKADKPCIVCGCPVGYTFGRARILCSKACQKKTESFKLARKAAKLRRKAIKRGANGGESVSPIKVFDAAGWKCQICNKPTPQKLRGTYHKRAPELDHIVAVSNGGAHTWANVQCACRECNLWKSNKLVVGQANLFGAQGYGSNLG